MAPNYYSAASSSASSLSSRPYSPTGRAAKALQRFQGRVKELKTEGKCNPDMVAFKELNKSLTPARTHGELQDVPIGCCVSSRGEMAILGIHRKILSGIDAISEEACYAVCISGGYADDDEATGGRLIYTGSGGQKARRQVKDQEKNTANRSLITSRASGTPIRVIRGKFGAYYYDGLFRCVDYTYAPSIDGPKVYKFVLEPIPGKCKPSKIRIPHDATMFGGGGGGGATRGGFYKARDRLMDKMKANSKHPPRSRVAEESVARSSKKRKKQAPITMIQNRRNLTHQPREERDASTAVSSSRNVGSFQPWSSHQEQATQARNAARQQDPPRVSASLSFQEATTNGVEKVLPKPKPQPRKKVPSILKYCCL